MESQKAKPQKARRLLSFNELRDRGITDTRENIRQRIKEGTFPRPVKPGPHRIAWFEDEIDEHIASLPRAEYKGEMR